MDYKSLRKNSIPLSDEERREALKRKAVWHHGPNGSEVSAIWKSKNPKTGKITYVTNTHRAMNTAPTLKGAIDKFFGFIKDTA